MGLFSSFRKRNPGASLFRILFWEFNRCLLGFWLFVIYRIKTWNRNNVPAEGPVLLISNHQSFLDLPAIAQAVRKRHFHPMARKTLFDNKLFGWHITNLNAFAVDQEKGDIAAIRTAVERLKAGHLVLIFPEGSRTYDGAIGDMQPGIRLIIKRAKPTVLPMAIDGAWDVLPPEGKLKWSGRIGVLFGKPIPAERFLAMENEESLLYMKKEIEVLRVELRQKMREASNGKYPLPGLGDEPCIPLDDLDQIRAKYPVKQDEKQSKTTPDQEGN